MSSLRTTVSRLGANLSRIPFFNGSAAEGWSILTLNHFNGRTTSSVRPNFEHFMGKGIKHLSTKPYSTEAALKLNEKIENDDDSLDRVGLRRKKIQVDGMWLNWDQAGSGDHVVLLLPGIIGCIQNDFGPIFRKMNKEKFTLVSWDPPGYGLSRPPQRDFSGIFYQRDAHTVVKLMDKLGHDKFSVLGWSNGGISGGHMAADYPDRVRNLVTWGAHSFADERAVMFTKIMGDLSVWSPKMLEPVLALYGREYLLKMMNDWHQAVYNFYHEGQDQVFKDGLPTIKCPTLVIHGEDDPVLGVDHAEFLRDNIKNSRMYIMPNAKHNLHLKFIDDFVSLVESFLLEGEEHGQINTTHRTPNME